VYSGQLGYPASPKFLESVPLTPEELGQRAGLAFSNISLLRRALTHRSYLYPEMDEGDLTRLRSALVRTEQLAAFARELGLGEALLLGRGEEVSGGRQRPALLCDAFEALIGALFLDAGIESVMRFMEPRFRRAADEVLEKEALLDPRSVLQMWAQAEHGETPRYETVDASGPDHAREFTVEVQVGEIVRAQGRGRSKQEAAQAAAEEALAEIGLNQGWNAAQER